MEADPKAYWAMTFYLFRKDWDQAVRPEFDYPIAKKTLALADLIPRTKAMSGHWVHQYNANERNEIIGAECRSVLAGVMGEEGVYFFGMYCSHPDFLIYPFV